jgi:hypothetical protein
LLSSSSRVSDDGYTGIDVSAVSAFRGGVAV